MWPAARRSSSRCRMSSFPTTAREGLRRAVEAGTILLLVPGSGTRAIDWPEWRALLAEATPVADVLDGGASLHWGGDARRDAHAGRSAGAFALPRIPPDPARQSARRCQSGRQLRRWSAGPSSRDPSAKAEFWRSPPLPTRTGVTSVRGPPGCSCGCITWSTRPSGPPARWLNSRLAKHPQRNSPCCRPTASSRSRRKVHPHPSQPGSG